MSVPPSGNMRRSPINSAGAGVGRQPSVSGPRSMNPPPSANLNLSRRSKNLVIANPDSEEEDEEGEGRTRGPGNGERIGPERGGVGEGKVQEDGEGREMKIVGHRSGSGTASSGTLPTATTSTSRTLPISAPMSPSVIPYLYSMDETYPDAHSSPLSPAPAPSSTKVQLSPVLHPKQVLNIVTQPPTPASTAGANNALGMGYGNGAHSKPTYSFGLGFTSTSGTPAMTGGMAGSGSVSEPAQSPLGSATTPDSSTGMMGASPLSGKAGSVGSSMTHNLTPSPMQPSYQSKNGSITTAGGGVGPSIRYLDPFAPTGGSGPSGVSHLARADVQGGDPPSQSSSNPNSRTGSPRSISVGGSGGVGVDVTTFRPLPIVGGREAQISSTSTHSSPRAPTSGGGLATLPGSRQTTATERSQDRMLPRLSTPPSIPLPLPPSSQPGGGHSHSTPHNQQPHYIQQDQQQQHQQQNQPGMGRSLSSPSGTGSPASPSRSYALSQSLTSAPLPLPPPPSSVSNGNRRPSASNHPVPTLPPRPTKHHVSNATGTGHGPLPALPLSVPPPTSTMSSSSTVSSAGGSAHPLPSLPVHASAVNRQETAGPRLGTVRLQVSTDNDNFMVVDVSGSTTSEAILERCFAKLRFRDDDYPSLAIYRTDIGESPDADPIQKQSIFSICQKEGDPKGHLKFLIVQTSILPSPSSAVVPPPISGSVMLNHTGFVYGGTGSPAPDKPRSLHAFSASSTSEDRTKQPPPWGSSRHSKEGSVSSASEYKGSPTQKNLPLAYHDHGPGLESDVHPYSSVAMNQTQHMQRHKRLLSRSRRMPSTSTSRDSRSPIEDKARGGSNNFTSPPPSLDASSSAVPSTNSSSLSTNAALGTPADRRGDATPTLPPQFGKMLARMPSLFTEASSSAIVSSPPEIPMSPERTAPAGPSEQSWRQNHSNYEWEMIGTEPTAADLAVIAKLAQEEEDETRKKEMQLADDARVALLEQQKEHEVYQRLQEHERWHRSKQEAIERHTAEQNAQRPPTRSEVERAEREREKLVGRERRERRLQWENRQQMARARGGDNVSSVVDDWRHIVSYDDPPAALSGNSNNLYNSQTIGASGLYRSDPPRPVPSPVSRSMTQLSSLPPQQYIDQPRHQSYDRAHGGRLPISSTGSRQFDTSRSGHTLPGIDPTGPASQHSVYNSRSGETIRNIASPPLSTSTGLTGLGLPTDVIYRDDIHRPRQTEPFMNQSPYSTNPVSQSVPLPQRPFEIQDNELSTHPDGTLCFPEPRPYSPSESVLPIGARSLPTNAVADENMLYPPSHIEGLSPSMSHGASSAASVDTVLASEPQSASRRPDGGNDETEDDSGNTARADNWKKSLSTMMGDDGTLMPIRVGAEEGTLDTYGAEETLWFTPPVPLPNPDEGTIVPGGKSPSLNLRPSKPSLKIDMNSSTYISQPNSAEDSEPTTSTTDPESTGTPSGASVSRSRSFARHKDQWNFRPPAEDVYENLQEFFPKIDLDKPLLDAAVTTDTVTDPIVYREEPQAVEKSASRKAAGFNKADARKSIRVVAEGRKRHLSRIAPATQQEEEKTSLARKRSSSMWGHKVVEVTPSGIKKGVIPEGVTEIKAEDGKPITMTWVKGDLIGKGSYGRVYLALNATTGDMIAVKQVEKPRTESDRADARQAGMIEALKSEIALLKDLEHPNVVTYLGWEESKKHLSIFLEYVPGGSIASVYRKHRKFEESVIKSFTAQILSGLQYLHSQNITHRDLKADNILVDPLGICKISDFGISKRTDDAYDTFISTNLKGSVFWMAPEVVHSVKGQGYSAKVDIWSLGCVVLEMWAGRRPWGDMEALAAMFQLANTRAAPPVPDDVNLSPAADDFLNKRCFASNPHDRPTATELLRHPFILDVDPNWTFEESMIGKAVVAGMKKR